MPVNRPYPARIDATLDQPLSRWLWLVKWLLAIPHYICLAFGWIAFVLLTVVAFFAILFTGRYPRAIFDFNVGVLRWAWRVSYYTTGGFGTDRYPPFTLNDVPDYPAHYDVDYPEHLSRGLVLVKSWLLAIPHWIIVGVFVGGGAWAASGRDGGDWQWSWGGGGLVLLLSLVAAVILLFRGSYPESLFDVILGLDRWVYRVAAYVALMTDEYPPFRLDMGGSEPSALVVAAPDALDRGSPPPSGHWTAGRITAVVVGSLLLLGGIGTALGATAVLTADQAGRDGDGFLNTPAHTFTGSGYALVFDPVEVRGEATTVGAVLGDVRVHATGSGPGSGVFVGIGPADAVEGYLATVERERIVGMRAGGQAEQQRLPGGAPAGPPGRQSFWVASAAGPGPQQLTWAATEGRWAAAVMNADGSRPVVAELSAGATAPGLRWVWTGMYIGAGIGLLAGIALVLIGTLRRRPAPRATA
jgi:Domain of unknown function (DUF4389)